MCVCVRYASGKINIWDVDGDFFFLFFSVLWTPLIFSNQVNVEYVILSHEVHDAFCVFFFVLLS